MENKAKCPYCGNIQIEKLLANVANVQYVQYAQCKKCKMIFELNKKISEHQLQVQIIQYLRVRNIFCFAVPNGFRGGQDKQKTAMYIKNMKNEGLTPGVSDIIVLLNSGKTVFLELKVGSNKQSENQKHFQSIVENLGFEYYIIKSLDDLIKIKEFK